MIQLHIHTTFTCRYRLFVSINIKWRRQKFLKKTCFFSFVNNSYSYWQKSTKFLAKVDYTDLHNILKNFKVLLTSTIFPPTVPFDPVSRFTPVSPIIICIVFRELGNFFLILRLLILYMLLLHPLWIMGTLFLLVSLRNVLANYKLCKIWLRGWSLDGGSTIIYLTFL